MLAVTEDTVNKLLCEGINLEDITALASKCWYDGLGLASSTTCCCTSGSWSAMSSESEEVLFTLSSAASLSELSYAPSPSSASLPLSVTSSLLLELR